MRTNRYVWFFLFISLALVFGGCVPQAPSPASQEGEASWASKPQVTFTLQTLIMDGKMVYVGSGGSIDGFINPDLVADEGVSFQIVLVNGDGMPHDLVVPEIGIQTAMVSGKGQSVTTTATISTSGEYAYYCTVSGHRQAGMEGKLIVREGE